MEMASAGFSELTLRTLHSELQQNNYQSLIYVCVYIFFRFLKIHNVNIAIFHVFSKTFCLSLLHKCGYFYFASVHITCAPLKICGDAEARAVHIKQLPQSTLWRSSGIVIS